ncbi:hypothetical protein SCB17_003110 [Clostridium perfringens]|nr:hypothetical protein [Clostridium perfringens]
MKKLSNYYLIIWLLLACLSSILMLPCNYTTETIKANIEETGQVSSLL